MSMTPFDVIIGLAPEPGYPANAKTYSRNIYHTSDMLNFELFDPSATTLINGQPIYLLNREIGEDTLYLSNSVFNRNVQFSSFHFLEVGNAYNPFYEYDGVAQQNRVFPYISDGYDPSSHQLNHVYSKKQGVDILSGYTAEMYYPSPTSTQYFASGINGSVNLNPGATQLACNMPAFNKPRVEWVVNNTDQTSVLNFNYYPNLIQSVINLSVWVGEDVLNCGNNTSPCRTKALFTLYDLSGQQLKTLSYLFKMGENIETFSISELGLTSGTYILKGRVADRINHFKIVVQ